MVLEGNHKVFLCHAASDKARVRQLYHELLEAGLLPWLDEEDILPGEDWEQEVKKAIRSTDYFVACLSKASVDSRGYFHKEITIALDVLDEIPEGKIFLIPVRLEECSVPDRLKGKQYVDLFDASGSGFQKLIKSLTVGVNSAYTSSIEIPRILRDSRVAREIFNYLGPYDKERYYTLRGLHKHFDYEDDLLLEQLSNLRNAGLVTYLSVSTKQPRRYYLTSVGLIIQQILKHRT